MNDTNLTCWQLSASSKLPGNGWVGTCISCQKLTSAMCHKECEQRPPPGINNFEMPRPTGRSPHRTSSLWEPGGLVGLVSCIGKQQQIQYSSAMQEAVEDARWTAGTLVRRITAGTPVRRVTAGLHTRIRMTIAVRYRTAFTTKWSSAGGLYRPDWAQQLSTAAQATRSS